jgi:peroxiredoxin
MPDCYRIDERSQVTRRCPRHSKALSIKETVWAFAVTIPGAMSELGNRDHPSSRREEEKLKARNLNLTNSITLEAAFAEVCQINGPLNQKLAAYARKLEELNFPFAEAYNSLVDRLIEGKVGSSAPKVGDRMPEFVLPTRSGELCSLQNLLETGPVVVSFNRGHWCPFCKIELSELAKSADAIAAFSGQIVTILPDRQLPVTDTQISNLKVLSDVDNGYALSLGLAVWLGDKLKELMKGRGIHLNEFQGNDGWFVPLPATFVVAQTGAVIARHADPEFRTRMDIETILAALAAVN